MLTRAWMLSCAGPLTILQPIMKTISVTICRTKRPSKAPRPAKLTGREPAMTGRKLIRWLKRQGAEPLPAKEKARLRKLGFLGMPDE
jgi:hypothetical protein